MMPFDPTGMVADMMPNVVADTPHHESSLLEELLDITCRKYPTVAHVIDQYGHLSLFEYVQSLELATIRAYQPRDDLFQVILNYAGALLGPSVARRTVEDLARCPVILTANHHGVGYFSQSIQAGLIFALTKLREGAATSTIPIFSCGNIPLNNSTYPRGLLVYHVDFSELETFPQKIPIFSKRFKNQMLNVVPSFEKPMIQSAVKIVDRLLQEGRISPTLQTPLRTVLREDYGDTRILSLSRYSDQSVALSSRIWRRLFTGIVPAAEMVHLEQESLVSALLNHDLQDSESLAWKVLFVPDIREQVLAALNGVAGCWERDVLSRRLLHSNRNDEQAKLSLKALEASGTMFFWGIAPNNRHIPLSLSESDSAHLVLEGVDDHGDDWRIPYTPESLRQALQERRLLPSGFTCFVVLSFARGVACLGGYFQCEYLPKMQHAIVTALQNVRGGASIAEIVQHVPTSQYLYGMLAVMTRIREGFLIPSGPLEIMTGGGMRAEDIDRILSLSVREAHLAALSDTLLDIIPKSLSQYPVKQELAANCAQLLQHRLVVK